MKKLFILVTLVLMAGAVNAADPVNNSIYSNVATSIISADHSVATWNLVDSVIVAMTDSCDTYYNVNGTVTLHRFQKLFIAFVKDAGSRVNIKSYEVPKMSSAPMTLTFSNIYFDSLRSQVSTTDTIKVYMAVKGSGDGEKVVVTDISLTGTVINAD